MDGGELGLVAEPSQWPEETQGLLQAAIDRRYVWPVVTSVERFELRNGYLQWTVGTDRGRYEFAMRWVSQQAPDFGPRGKLLIDADDNGYRLLDVDGLPPRARALVRKYVYW